MKYYPVLLDVNRRPCLVIGGGTIAEQKVASLCKAGATVTVLSPELTPTLAEQVTKGEIRHDGRPYRAGDLKGYFLVFAATDDEAVHAQIAAEGESLGILVNVVDRPALCRFIVPAIVERGDLILSISTSGASPAVAKQLRQCLEEQFGVEYATVLRIFRELRQIASARNLSFPERQEIFGQLAREPLPTHVRNRDEPEIDRLLTEALGSEATLARLGIGLP